MTSETISQEDKCCCFSKKNKKEGRYYLNNNGSDQIIKKVKPLNLGDLNYTESVYTSSQSFNSYRMMKDVYDDKLKNGLKSCIKGNWMYKFNKRGGGNSRIMYINDSYDCVSWGKRKSNKNTKIMVSEISSVDSVYDKAVLNKNVSLETVFSIVTNDRTYYFECGKRNRRNKWVSILKWCSDNYKTKNSLDLLYLRGEWEKSDLNKDNKLNLYEIENLLEILNIKIRDDKLRVMIDKVSDEEFLNFFEFVRLRSLLILREELRFLFEVYAANRHLMTLREFSDFLNKEQGQKLRMREANNLLKKTIVSYVDNSPLSFHEFTEYLSSSANYPRSASKETNSHEMDLPLNNYLIASSHNTYLKDKQLIGLSAVEMYVRALNKGCRCVELDCWNGSNGEPIIHHGFTLTTKILFRDVINALKENAFIQSPYPVILSIENHCDLFQQNQMAKILKSIFEDSIALPSNFKDKTKLPSPIELKEKFILKVKIPKKKINSKNNKIHKMNLSLDPELEKLIFFSSIQYLGEDIKKYNVFDIVSTSFSNFLKNDREIKTISDNIFVRVFPDGTSINSGNFNPTTTWLSGVQLTSLNYQKISKETIINDALFELNNRTGYVLKPQFLYNMEKNQLRPSKLILEVISAAYIPKKKKVPTATLR